MLRPRARHNGDLHTINFCEFYSPQWSDIKQAHGGATVTGFSGQCSTRLWGKERNETNSPHALAFGLLVIPLDLKPKCESISCSVVSDSATPWTTARQAPLSMGFTRQEYWSGLPCPPPGDLSDAGVQHTSLMSPALTGRFLSTSSTWEAPSGRATIIQRLDWGWGWRIHFFFFFLKVMYLPPTFFFKGSLLIYGFIYSFMVVWLVRS